MLRTPQARVLQALAGGALLTRARLSERAGYTAVSGTVTRALNGIHPGSTSGDAHPGLLTLGLVREVMLDLDGLKELNYEITPAGQAALAERLAQGDLPETRPVASCTNRRYAYLD